MSTTIEEHDSFVARVSKRYAGKAAEFSSPDRIALQLLNDLETAEARVVELDALQSQTVEGALVTEDRARKSEARVAELEAAIRSFRDDEDDDRAEAQERLFGLLSDGSKEGGA